MIGDTSGGKVIVVVGGQFGSEGKGAICAYLAQMEPGALLAMRVAGPNAGHTVIGLDGEEYKFRHVPVAAVVRPDAELALGAGSEIDFEVLQEELDMTNEVWKTRHRILIDPTSTVIEPEHKVMEAGIGTGTTGKGIGAARAERLLRRAELVSGTTFDKENTVDWGDTTGLAIGWLKSGGTVMIEGTQGYGLGQHAGFYPYVTSGDCRATDFLAMAGIPPWADYVRELEIWVVLRTYPIRIAGNSGPLVEELTWEDLAHRTNGHIKPEFTTVTKKMRRIGEWEKGLAMDAIDANGGPKTVKVALTFADYVIPDLADTTIISASEAGLREISQWLDNRLPSPYRNCIKLIGTGQDSVIDTRVGSI